jgi:hypothetical protein
MARRLWQDFAGALRSLGNARLRSELITRLRYRGRHFQGPTTTSPDRYPLLFAQCRAALGSLSRPRILSFGCSTGEEVFSLRQYLPHAEIVGVEINRWCLEQCTLRSPDDRMHFLHRDSPEFAQSRDFDAIFALAVFQRSENRRDHRDDAAYGITSGFTFDRFEQELLILDAKLKMGGLFFIDHADFALDSTALGSRYQPLSFAGNQVVNARPLYGPDGRVVGREQSLPRVYVKLAETPASGTEPTFAMV